MYGAICVDYYLKVNKESVPKFSRFANPDWQKDVMQAGWHPAD